MKLENIKDHYENLIIGAGITGAGIFRDLSLHNQDTLIIDKNDFTSQTSQSSSKMLHGGIRYLENMDFALVYEALHEKNLWLKLTPHLAKERAFILPVYKNSKKPLWMLRIGLFLYDFLSGFKNSPHRVLSSEEVLKELPTLESKSLVGAGLYYDSVMDDAKITLEVIYDALKRRPQNHALNYVSFKTIKIINDKTYEVELFDEITNESKKVTTNNLIFATGPFSDKVLKGLDFLNWKDKLLPSKGSHLYIKKSALPVNKSMVLMTSDNRIIFVIPNELENKVLVGTTESEVSEDFNNLKASEEDINYLLKCLKEYFPGSEVKHEDILSSFAGVRPLVKSDSGSLGTTARVHKIFQPRSNLFVIIGGKYTTFRVMAQDLVIQLFQKNNKQYNPNLSLLPLLQPSVIKPFDETDIKIEDVQNILLSELPRTLDDLMIRRIGFRSIEEIKESKVSNENLLKIIKESDILSKVYVSKEMKDYWFN